MYWAFEDSGPPAAPTYCSRVHRVAKFLRLVGGGPIRALVGAAGSLLVAALLAGGGNIGASLGFLALAGFCAGATMVMVRWGAPVR